MTHTHFVAFLELSFCISIKFRTIKDKCCNYFFTNYYYQILIFNAGIRKGNFKNSRNIFSLFMSLVPQLYRDYLSKAS